MPGVAESVPSRFPIFPLAGALLLPRGNLPLNIFEPRYLAMVRDAMLTDRVIGMIQPMAAEAGRPEDEERQPALYRTGCAGRVTSFSETGDGRFLIMLTGLCRFDIAEELQVTTPYRQVVADFSRWRGDLSPASPSKALQPRLLRATRAYFGRRGIEADWDQLEAAPLATVVTSLAMLCPFEPSEKQALLEAADLSSQAELLVSIMEMNASSGDSAGAAVRH